MILYLCVLMNWFSVFSWSVKYAFTFAWFLNQRLLWEYFFSFFGDFSVIKARKLHQTRSKTCPFEAFAREGLMANHSDLESGGLESPITSRDKFALFAFLCLRQKQIQPHLPNVAVHPPYNAETYLQFLLIFNIVLRRKGKSSMFLKGKQRFFETSLENHR